MSAKKIDKLECKKTDGDEEDKVSTPIPHHKEFLKENSMMMDYTDYMSCNSGDESDSLQNFRSRSCTPTKLFKRRITSKMPPSQLMTKLAEKQRKAEEKRMNIIKEKEECFRKAREKEK
jgi:hypothetical protein